MPAEWYSVCQGRLGKGKQFFAVLFLWRASHWGIVFSTNNLHCGKLKKFNLHFELIAIRTGCRTLNEIPSLFHVLGLWELFKGCLPRFWTCLIRLHNYVLIDISCFQTFSFFFLRRGVAWWALDQRTESKRVKIRGRKKGILEYFLYLWFNLSIKLFNLALNSLSKV